MKRRMLNLLVCLVMIISMFPVTAHAAAGSMEVKIIADKTAAAPGDTITYTVYAGAVTNMLCGQFQVSIPNGLTYVEKSATLADGIKTTLGAASVDWTEKTYMFTFYGIGQYTSTADTALMTFQCTVDADASGSYTAMLADVEFGNSEYEEYEVTVSSTAVTVKTADDSKAESTIKESTHTEEKATDSNGTAVTTEQKVQSNTDEVQSATDEAHSEVGEQSTQTSTGQTEAIDEKESEPEAESAAALITEGSEDNDSQGGHGMLWGICGIVVILTVGIFVVIYKRRKENS